jgi:D-proline reductase (dithiol) PrdB
VSEPVRYISRIARKYERLGHGEYAWVRNSDPPPWQPLRRPLAEARVGLVASGGIYVAGQVAFHYKDDTSYRVIPADVETSALRVTHFAYDLTDARHDPNVVFPIDTLRGLAAEGTIGELAPRTLGFMGGIYSARRVLEELAEPITRELVEQQVDVALFVPV